MIFMSEHRSIIALDGAEYFDKKLSLGLKLTVRAYVGYSGELDDRLIAATDKAFEKILSEGLNTLARNGCSYDEIIRHQAELCDMMKEAVGSLENMRRYIKVESLTLRELYPALEDHPRIIKAKKRIADSGSITKTWVCKGCGSEQTGKFCKICGTGKDGTPPSQDKKALTDKANA